MGRISTNGFLIGFTIAVNFCFGQDVFTEVVLKDPNDHKAFFDSVFTQNETPIYSFQLAENKLLLENGYASFAFQNPENWPIQGINAIPTHVNVVFTKYPKDKEFWLTDYQWLLSKRLQALFELDSAFNSAAVSYSMLLQTECDNEFEAMQLFHGIEITYQIRSDVDLPEKTNGTEKTNLGKSKYQASEQGYEQRYRSEIRKLQRIQYQDKFTSDSTVYDVLDRNKQWQKALLVLDWTGSVYGYGAEAMLWHILNEENSGIEHYALFNDGNKTKNRNKVIGYTGGVYSSSVDPLPKVLKQLKRVQGKGKGGDSSENDIEALITAIADFPEAESVILLADNYSCMRDYVLNRYVKKPVHIVLIGRNKYINPQYLNLAWRTGGSIHTKDFDLTNINDLVRKDSLIINDIKYTLTINNQLMPENKEDNKFGYCNKYYLFPKSKNKTKTKRRDPECYFTK